MPLSVIVAGEESGITRDAFIDQGCVAYSCDLKPSRSSRGPHFQCSWRDLNWGAFDLAIAHPECTHLSVSGARWFPQKKADGRQAEAMSEFMWLTKVPVKRLCIEQPVSIMSTYFRKPDQIVQPWMFGVWETKATCYWLKGLPLLFVLYRTLDECREALGISHDQKPHARVHKMPPSEDRAAKRAETYPVIAAAMAKQWGSPYA
jgi:hypothetical protein